MDYISNINVHEIIGFVEKIKIDVGKNKNKMLNLLIDRIINICSFCNDNKAIAINMIKIMNLLFFVLRFIVDNNLMPNNALPSLFQDIKKLFNFTNAQIRNFDNLCFDKNICFIDEHIFHNNIIQTGHITDNTPEYAVQHVDNNNDNIMSYTKFNQMNQKKCDINDKIEDTICVICVSELEINDGVIITKCNHIFHRECIKVWLTKHNKSCPICRKKL